MNWRPHKAARALGGARADAVGLVVARPAQTIGAEPFFGLLLAGLQAGLSARSVALHLMIVEDTAAEIEVYRRWTSERHVDGFVLVDLQHRDRRVPVLEELGVPAVVIGGPGGHGSLPSVWADDREAMLSLVDYLAALGHRRIAHVAGDEAFHHTRRRIRALKDAARRLHLTDAVSVPTDFSDAQGASATRALLSSPQPAHRADLRLGRDGRRRPGGGRGDGGGGPGRPVGGVLRGLVAHPHRAPGDHGPGPGHLRPRRPGRGLAAGGDRRTGIGARREDGDARG